MSTHVAWVIHVLICDQIEKQITLKYLQLKHKLQNLIISSSCILGHMVNTLYIIYLKVDNSWVAQMATSNGEDSGSQSHPSTCSLSEWQNPSQQFGETASSQRLWSSRWSTHTGSVQNAEDETNHFFVVGDMVYRVPGLLWFSAEHR